MAAGEETPGTQTSVVVFFGNDAGTEFELVRPGNPLPVSASITPSGTQDVNVKQISATTVLTGAGATGAGSQRVTIAQDSTTIAGSSPGTVGVPSPNVLTVQNVNSGTATETNVASSATSVTILSANIARLGATIFNDSTQILYLLLGTGPASNSKFTVQLVANAYYELPFKYSGIITGIWASANGNARVEEFTV